MTPFPPHPLELSSLPQTLDEAWALAQKIIGASGLIGEFGITADPPFTSAHIKTGLRVGFHSGGNPMITWTDGPDFGTVKSPREALIEATLAFWWDAVAYLAGPALVLPAGFSRSRFTIYASEGKVRRVRREMVGGMRFPR